MHRRADVRVIRRGAGVGEGPKFHVCGMPTDFSLFRDRLAEAYRVRGTTSNAVCRNIGLGRRRSVDLTFSGLKALDIYRLAQIADRPEVSVDWLLGRSDVMELPNGNGKQVA
jgi:hypothetical protein